MKGEYFGMGDKVQVIGHTGQPYNNQMGVVVGTVQDEGRSCVPYIVDLGRTRVAACACHLLRLPPKHSNLNRMIDWSQCAWRPHLGKLPKATFQAILKQIDICEQRRGKKHK